MTARYEPGFDWRDVSVLIPWRSDNGPREAAFRWLLPRWESTGAEVCVGIDDGPRPFNCSKAQNRAFALSTRSKLVMFGADQVPSLPAIHAAEARLGPNTPWFPLMETTAYYSEAVTHQILTGRLSVNTAPIDYELPFCTGVIALTRDAYLASGGMDERFEGWGYEDAAFRQTLAGLFGLPAPEPLQLRCLWHATDHRKTGGPNEALMQDYLPLTDPVSTRAYLENRGAFL